MEKSIKLYKRASLLAIITIFYNLVEGVVSVFFGVTDETLSLFGFGIDSEAILEDANCTRACLYFSFTLLLASAGYELTGIGGIDSIGAILIAVFSFREGRESFEKANSE